MFGHSSGGHAVDGLDGLPPDPLSDVLGDLRLAEGSYGRCELTRPWGLAFAPQKLARFHFIVAGACWLKSPRADWVKLRAGDVVLVPHGTGHVLAHSAAAKTRPLESFPVAQVGDRAYELRAGGAGPRVLLACCSVRFDGAAAPSLLELMPAVLLVPAGGSDDPVLPVLLDAMADEVIRRRLGAATVMTRLADVVITRLVRAWAERAQPGTRGWLAAIRDPSLGRTLAAIHRRPGEPWTVDSLAEVAHVSRSVFAERFMALVGVSPARYLARHRMHLASLWLRGERATVAEVAERLGYDSAASFSRAFKRHLGRPPSAIRRERGDEGGAHR